MWRLRPRGLSARNQREMIKESPWTLVVSPSVEKGGGETPPPFLWVQVTQEIFPVPKITFKLRFVRGIGVGYSNLFAGFFEEMIL